MTSREFLFDVERKDPTVVCQQPTAEPPATNANPKLAAKAQKIEEKDLYAVLGLRKDCSDEDIKRTYKKLAIKYHPDKNGGDERASEKFQEIASAYAILSDQKQKEIYDKFGMNGLFLAREIENDDDIVKKLMHSHPCVKVTIGIVGVLTLGYFCCCCFCCCDCCCGRCVPCMEKIIGKDYARLYRQAVKEAEIAEVLADQSDESSL